MFGVCAKKCGRIAISAEKRLCKEKCRKVRDDAIEKARTKMKAQKIKDKAEHEEKLLARGQEIVDKMSRNVLVEDDT